MTPDDRLDLKRTRTFLKGLKDNWRGTWSATLNYIGQTEPAEVTLHSADAHTVASVSLPIPVIHHLSAWLKERGL